MVAVCQKSNFDKFWLTSDLDIACYGHYMTIDTILWIFLAPTGELYNLLCHRGLGVLLVLLLRENSHFLQ